MNAPVLAQSSLLEPGRNCMDIANAERLAIIIDAEDYFRCARRAMLNARRRITLIGWDFDARIKLDRAQDLEGPDTLGQFVYWLVKRSPDLEVFLLRWNAGIGGLLKRGSTPFTLLKWMSHPRIHTKLDGAHPVASSHHQKIVLIDDCLAFCGGIDMTGDRWDTRDHKPNDERRRRPTTKRRYKPWHDATTAITGPAVDLVARICRERWRDAGGTPSMDPIEANASCWPDGLRAQFHDIPLAVARTIPKYKDRAAIHEIERLWSDQIAAARERVYIESQYFASRVIASAIGKRLLEENGPEFVIVNPQTAEGWLEPIAMDTARARLLEGLRRIDRFSRLRVYHPFNAGGEAIYVHAKILIVDDRILRIGSANVNNRSMRLDTECDVVFDTALGKKRYSDRIAGVRNDLLAEHLGSTEHEIAETLAETNSLIDTIERLRGERQTLRPYSIPDLSDAEEWLADNEVLDPEGPDEMFEPLSKRGLWRNALSVFRR